uniref:highly divergent homeobox isoform X2 n=1 Tax=Myxine glutinosa TaxID=7769 RepID=UPI00358F59CF
MWPNQTPGGMHNYGQMYRRSVITPEQQLILERFYENGMTNQSNHCVPLIVQCSHEAGLNYSVVRAWIGNKRRKLVHEATKGLLAAQQGSMEGSTTIGSARGVVPGSNAHAGATSHPVSQFSGRYGRPGAPESTYQARCTPRASQVGHTRYLAASPKAPSCSPLEYHVRGVRQALRPNMALPLVRPLEARGIPTGPRSCHSRSQVQLMPGRTIKMEPVGIEESPSKSWQASYSIQRGASTGIRSILPASRTLCPAGSLTSHQGSRLQIRSVVSLGEQQQHSSVLHRPNLPGGDGVGLSIAMATGDLDEYSLEEERAREGPQTSQECESANIDGGTASQDWCLRGTTPSPSASIATASNPSTMRARDLSPERAVHAARSLVCLAESVDRLSTTSQVVTQRSEAMHSPSSLTPTTYGPAHAVVSPFAHGLLQSGGSQGGSHQPFLHFFCGGRKRVDRTQFSPQDLALLKRFWDDGMTSLGSICKEKMESVAAELNIDCEIVRNWIGNQRRRYRHQGREPPPPRGGPPSLLHSVIPSASPEPIGTDGLSQGLPSDPGSSQDVFDNWDGEEMAVCSGPASIASDSSHNEAVSGQYHAVSDQNDLLRPYGANSRSGQVSACDDEPVDEMESEGVAEDMMEDGGGDEAISRPEQDVHEESPKAGNQDYENENLQDEWPSDLSCHVKNETTGNEVVEYEEFSCQTEDLIKLLESKTMTIEGLRTELEQQKEQNKMLWGLLEDIMSRVHDHDWEGLQDVVQSLPDSLCSWAPEDIHEIPDSSPQQAELSDAHSERNVLEELSVCSEPEKRTFTMCSPLSDSCPSSLLEKQDPD